MPETEIFISSNLTTLEAIVSVKEIKSVHVSKRKAFLRENFIF
jgi:hypothetical protein